MMKYVSSSFEVKSVPLVVARATRIKQQKQSKAKKTLNEPRQRYERDFRSFFSPERLRTRNV